MSKLKSSFFKGVIYTGIARYASIVVRIFVAAILARYISPADFGVVAIAAIFINYFSILSTVGIAPAIVQNKDINESELKKINGFTFILAVIVTILFIICIPLIQKAYNNHQELEIILYLLSLNILFSIASIVPNALIMRKKEFGFIAGRTFMIQLVLGLISCICAIYGMGIYALLINPIFTSISLFVVNFIKEPVGLDFHMSKQCLKKISSFSAYQTLFNFVYLLYRNIDKIIIGKYFGMSELGYYEKSYSLMLLPLENVSTVISPVLHPILSEYQNDKDTIWRVYLRMIRMLSEISFVLSVSLYYLSGHIILLLYGENWMPAVPYFKILSLSVCFQLLQSPIGAVLQSINKVKALFYGSLWITISMIICLLVGVIVHNMTLLVIGVLVSFTFGFFAYQYYLISFFGKRISEVLNILKPYLYVSFVLFVLCFIIENLVIDLTPCFGLSLFITATLASYFTLYKLNLLNETTIVIQSIISKFKLRK